MLAGGTLDEAATRLALDRALARFVPDAHDRAFVVRCIAEEGPVHHRGASYALIALLGLALDAAGGPLEAAPDGPRARVPMRLPPHLQRREDGEHDFPLSLPLAPLERIAPAGSRELEALVDHLTDGPPHHALANAAMVSILGALLERLERRPSEPPRA
ncbi:MAG: hypothetical protein IT385_06580 [Deltaproteobacteria bacterium]|nr:hypothetical protein [Deltaproteobacteria bacterium]